MKEARAKEERRREGGRKRGRHVAFRGCVAPGSCHPSRHGQTGYRVKIIFIPGLNSIYLLCVRVLPLRSAHASRARAARGSVIKFSFSLISAKASSTMALLPAAMRSILRARSTRVRRAARDLQAGGGGGGCSSLLRRWQSSLPQLDHVDR